jgi:protein-disulfide isomerase
MTRFETPPLATLPPVAPVDERVDHVRGPADGHLILVYADYECPYSRAAYRIIERVERTMGGTLRFAFRHFPLSQIHPHALAASAAAEAAALQGRFWEMSEVLFRRQAALKDRDLRSYATKLGLDVSRFDVDRAGGTVLARVGRDIESGRASRQVRGTPTVFIDGALHQGAYDAASLMKGLET